MQRLLFIIIFIFLPILLFSQSVKYQKIIYKAERNEIQELRKQSFDFETVKKTGQGEFIAEISEIERKKLDNAGIEYRIIIEDMSEFYRERYKKSKQNPKEYQPKYETPENFNYGSMGGFLTLDEIYSELDDMAALYPDLITPKTQAGTQTSIEGREIYFVKIGRESIGKNQKPKILYNSLIHAREPAAMQALIWYMWYLLENYENDEEIAYLINNIDMYFIPAVNPDGYVYNETIEPEGGGMHRKNRRATGSEPQGVDLNRNFGYQWAYDDEGSSPIPTEQTYRGESAFSEPETQIIKEFCESHNFLLAHNHHTYSNLMIFPWGYEEIHTPEDELFRTFANVMVAENGYTPGQGWEILYTANGDANDWMYGSLGTYPFTQETGNQEDGFWPAYDRILPLCEESFLPNLYLARFATEYAEIYDASPEYMAQEGYIRLNLKRLGLSGNGNYQISIEPHDNAFTSSESSLTIENMQHLEMKTDSFPYSLNPNVEYGTSFSYTINVSSGDFTSSKSFTKYFQNSTEIITESGDDLNNWQSEEWSITDRSFYTPDYSITDSYYGNYQVNSTNSISLNESIDLSQIDNAYLTFWAKWAIETDWDYVQLYSSLDEGASWQAMHTRHTNLGVGESQPINEPLYDGYSGWVKDSINLQDYIGEQVKFRFSLVSDAYVNADGFYFDDFKIFSLLPESSTKSAELSAQSIKIYPNPAKEYLHIDNAGDTEILKVEISGLSGSLLKEISPADMHNAINIGGLKSGIYFVKLFSKKATFCRKIIIR